MHDPNTLVLLRRLAAGELTVEQAAESLSRAPFEDLGVALVDHHRALRQGVGEVVWGEGKSEAELQAIVRALAARGEGVLVTRLEPAHAQALELSLSAAGHRVVRSERARTLRVLPAHEPQWLEGTALVVTAGTSDEPVAAECEQALAMFAVRCERLTDVGVAGLHRILAQLERLRAADVVIVIAGMEGALPSVVGGLVSAPVIAVPTSVGYGAAAAGWAALAGMLTSCASGVTVCNIDNGFGAAFAARRILQRRGEATARSGA